MLEVIPRTWTYGRTPMSVTASGCPRSFAGASLQSLRTMCNSISKNDLRQWIKLLRVHQYAKNLLVFLPALTAHKFSADAFFTSFLAFTAFSLCASGVYIINDLVDLGIRPNGYAPWRVVRCPSDRQCCSQPCYSPRRRQPLVRSHYLSNW